MISRTFKLCLNAGNGSAPYINVNQYDEGETWLFELYSENGERYIPSSGAIVGVKSDGHGIVNTGTVDSEGRVVITETQQMTASAGRAIYELSIDSLTHGTANFIVDVEQRAGENAIPSESDLSLLQEAINSVAEIENLLDGQDVPTVITPIISNWLDDNITNPSNPPIDTSLSVAGAAADAKKTGDEISDLKSQINRGGITEEVKQALLACFRSVLFRDDNDSYDALYSALYPPVSLLSITAVYTQSGTVYDTDSLGSLKSDLVVTAHYDDSTTATVTNYTLSGTLAEGTSTITVMYGGKTTTFTVIVSSIPADYQQVEWVGFDGNSRIVTDAEIDNKMRYEAKVQFTQPTSEQVALCVANNSYSTRTIEVSQSTLYRTFTYTSASIAITDVTGLYEHPSELILDFENGVKTDYLLTNNDIDYSASGVQTQNNPNLFAGCVFTLGSARKNASNLGFIGRIYYARYIKNGTTVADLVACYRKSDGVIGFFDKVTQTFITNTGSGTFTKGGDI